jgi:2-dehydropantoate 2-reductase
MEPDRSIVIFGAGAVGGYLGGKLASGGASVTLVAREALVEAVQSRGLRIRETRGDETSHPTVVASSANLPPAGVVVLTTRAYDVMASIPEIGQLLAPDGCLIAMQNGVGTEEFIGSALGRERVIAGTLTAAVRALEPGVITRAGNKGGIALAALEGSVSGPVLDMFGSTGLQTVGIEDYRSLRWSKLLLNMLGAATSAILDVNIDKVVGDGSVFKIEQQAFREAVRVMEGLGIQAARLPAYSVGLTRFAMQLPGPLPRLIVGGRLKSSRGGRSPMMRSDLIRGKTEVRWLNGAVADAAESIDLEAPVNTALAELIEDLAANPARREIFRDKPEALVAELRNREIQI